MDKNFIKWASGIMALIGLLAYISNAAIRLNEIEKKSCRVPEIERQLKIINLYIKIVDPTRFKQAEELAE